MTEKLIRKKSILLFFAIGIFGACDNTESKSLTLTSLTVYQSNDCTGTGYEEYCDYSGSHNYTETQISCLANSGAWVNEYQNWANSIEDINTFNSSVNLNDNSCFISYDSTELTGVWSDNNSCQVPLDGAIESHFYCREFIFTEE